MEYRQFLLYTEVIALKNVLSENMYLNFITLHVATTILSSPHFSVIEDYLNYAEDLLIYFVDTFQSICDKKYISHNIHNLLHLINDVRKFSHLGRFSAFKFENTIFKMKYMIRKYDKPLQQIARRFLKNQNIVFEERRVCKEHTNSYIKKKNHNQGPLTHRRSTAQYKKMRTSNYCIDVDNCKDDSVLVDDIFVKVYNFAKYDNTFYLIGKQLFDSEIYFDPCVSSRLSSNIVTLGNVL